MVHFSQQRAHIFAGKFKRPYSAYPNVSNYGSSESILKKWIPNEERHYPARRKRKSEVKVLVPDHVTCQGFAWYGAKMWNLLPVETRELTNPESFKVAIKTYIWDNIPSY